MMENINLTPEMLEKAKNAADAKALAALAKEYHIDLTAQEAQTYFNALHNEKSGELNEDALDMVAGGFHPMPIEVMNRGLELRQEEEKKNGGKKKKGC